MCGVFGYIERSDSQKKIDHNVLEQMSNCISYRGPDNSGKFEMDHEDYKIKLYHHRLSIQGLGRLGNQPYKFNDYVVLYNGEIYNYKFLKKILVDHQYKLKSNCDTELIAPLFELFGHNFIEKIDGIFSIIIYNSKNHQIFMYNDCFGVKPLYFYSDQEKIIFSSELSSFKFLNYDINFNAVKSFFIGSYNSFKESYFKNVFQLKPSKYLKFNLNNFNSNEYEYKTKLLSSEDSLYNNIDKVVKDQLISDVPVGIMLSGGLDSSIVLHHASKYIKNFKAYTVDYGFNKLDVQNAKILSKSLNIDLVVINLNKENDNFFSILNNVYNEISEPIGDSAYIGTFLICKKAKNDGIKVLLSGAGGDEIFGGYSRYINNYKDIFRKLFFFLSYFKSLSPKLLKIVDINFDMFTNTSGCFSEVLNLIKTTEVNSFITKFSNEFKSVGNSLESKMLFDLKSYLPNDIFKLTDLASMNNSIEVRVPLTSVIIKNFVSSTFNNQDYINKSVTKNKLRKLYKNFLPREVIEMKKMGFGAPVNHIVDKCKPELIDFIKVNSNKLDLFDVEKINYNSISNNLLFHLFIYIKWKLK